MTAKKKQHFHLVFMDDEEIDIFQDILAFFCAFVPALWRLLCAAFILPYLAVLCFFVFTTLFSSSANLFLKFGATFLVSH